MKAILNYFKKAIAPKVDTQTVIAEIHNEFDTAGERLLAEAKNILSQEVDINKGERLKSIGFSSAKSATDAERILKEKKESKVLAELIEYYRQWYPTNKFITETIVEQICKKYNLLCSDVSCYIGDVPDKNLMEIEQFKLREEDKEQGDNISDYYKMRSSFMMIQSMSRIHSIGISMDDYEYPDPPKEKRTYMRQPSFKICAPETDFNTRGYTKQGYNLIPDPIVLQPVKGGFLCVSKWGLESGDDLVVNEKMN